MKRRAPVCRVCRDQAIVLARVTNRSILRIAHDGERHRGRHIGGSMFLLCGKTIDADFYVEVPARERREVRLVSQLPVSV